MAVLGGPGAITVRVGCQFEYEAPLAVPSLWQVRPLTDSRHRIVSETWETPGPARSYNDSFGNHCDRFTLPPGRSVVRYDATLEVSSAFDEIAENAKAEQIDELPDQAFVYLLPSRFCWPDVLYGSAWELFGNVAPGWARVQAVCDWVHDNIAYQLGASSPVTSALDVWESRTGVCRDFTQLAMTLCRALNVPARYVAGYIPDIAVVPPDLPMDFCSWFEAWLDGRWWTFDPRNNEPRVGRVVIARGRDALDAAMVTTWGPAVLQSMTVWADDATPSG
jgi:transglutaminase-like putative cysteine protease